ncbi:MULTISPECIES: SAM-dependent methyltransferase [Pseudoalteromonas]|uniref:Cyclopropane-fatty-acyl-phospholipid synthase n=1 Tax=Pseudoalteromonas amylolytica TaxID=1859457 RepID=A0A1S1N426_9GAMM|nr:MULTISPECIES: cyclopropane-fatty-acyl-phospholipid synthase family protein [Pseudoalteromonas]OHU85421.1 cyclopropane-fatty-acyl-phospholipid synthase [Pseudoalteromonas sp. JW3]OHU92958.1 cyclopropane-fatty-acyl-phospholipid synthase [Pseudoalteromonas amylolytica]
MENTTVIQRHISLSWIEKLYRRLVFSAFESIQTGHLKVIMGEQVYEFGETGSEYQCTVTIVDPAMFKLFALGGSVGAAEAYIEGYWRCSNLTTLIEIFALNQSQLDAFEKKFAFITGFANNLRHLRNKNSKQGSKKNIAAHYDLGNELYSSFLSEEMLYSSAIYPNKTSTLEQAQQHKLETICTQLDLKPGEQVIEIGTGWGAFAIFAAQKYGCHVTTTTISEEQFTYVSEKIKELGLESRITLLKQDYRELQGRFDKLVSIEMIEAVGHEYLAGFFAKCDALLKDNGAMLIQAITIACQRYPHYLKKSDFIQQYIFPGGCLPSITELNKQLCNNTNMVVHSISDIGLHYARTLHDWYRRFKQSWPTLDHSKFDQRFYRLWEFYLCYCEGAFKQRATSTVHLVARKPNYVSSQCCTTLNY